ncbi:hypothetical protein A374_01324 [Fictibacillus macauensis ZFHKF-1]|uniref:Spo0E like sporulation regulatory protein n=1 Tax=Fictibacillus macauensis ZFHKF-1 TaxID=1196324 RepID=I8UK26_9BACL|nr:aspartyl-phosphate phosphatase Spo0E family protein [Fictibacillus macauensis]EIT87240.1 hypothetical protein A374_01324 [Fictibacillus macauensis ZFHKF-1]
MFSSLHKEMMDLIENKRIELVQSAECNGIQAAETVNRGRELNELLNCYQRLITISPDGE